MFDHLSPIGLSEVLEAAELQTRVDRKYLVDVDDLARLLSESGDQFAVLEIGRVRQFDYESVYFDTPGLDSYMGAARGRRRRFKVRTRAYVDSLACMLEIKTRQGAATVKDRFDYAFADRHRLTEEGRRRIAASGRVPAAPAVLAPALVTRYARATLLHLPTGTRVTCDTGLRFEDVAGRIGAISPQMAVVETKSPGRSGPVDRRLWRAGYRPCPISKYGTGMAFLYPDLPANKWNRTLRRHFGWCPGALVPAGHPGRST